MNSQYEEVVILLSQLQTPKFKESEQRLELLLKKQPNFYQNLKSVILDPRNMNHVRLTAAVYINKLIKDSLQNTKPQLLFQVLVDFLKDSNIQNFYKRQLQKCIIEFIGQYGTNLLGSFINLCKQLFQLQLSNPAYLIIAAFTIPELATSDLLYFIGTIFPFSLEPLANRICLQNAENLNQWAKATTQIIDKLIIKQQSEPDACKSIMNIICHDPRLNKIIYDVYRFQSSQGTFLCMKQQLDQLNLLKYEISQVHIKLVKSMINLKIEMKQQWKILNECLPYFYNTLFKVSKNKQLMSLNHCQDFTINIMKLMTRMIKNTANFQIFSQLAPSLINQVIFPFLDTTEDQYQSFKDDPTQFIALSEDICDKQTFQILKTEAANMLQAITDYLDGTLSYVVRIAVASIAKHFNILSNSFQNIQCSLNVEKSLLVLTILSCALGKRQDLIMHIKQIFTYPIVERMNDLQLCRLFLFLAYNYEELFKDPVEGQPLLSFAYNYQKQQATCIQAIDFVCNIAESFYSDQIFRKISDKIQYSQVANLWDALLTYTSKKYDAIPEELMLYLIEKLWLRIQKQFNKLLNDSTQITILMVKSIQIIKSITINHLYLKNKPILENRIWQIISTILLPENIINFNFQDQLISVLDELINGMQVITERELKILPILKNILKIKNNFALMEIFHTLNIIINKLNFNTYPQTQPYLAFIIQLLILGLQANSQNKKDKCQDDVGQALLLLQLVIYKYGRYLPEAIFINIYSNSYRVFQKLQLTGSIIRVINLWLLMYPYCKNIGYLTEKNRQSLQHLVTKCNLFYSHEIRVAVFALCNILFLESDLQFLKELIKVIVILLTKLNDQIKSKQLDNDSKNTLKSSKKTAKTKLKKRNQQKLKPFKASFKKMIWQIKKLDVFQLFRNQLQTMKTNNQPIYQILINSLPSQTMQGLKEVGSLAQITNSVRKIYKISNVKSVNLIQNDKKIINQMQKQDSESEEEERNVQQQQVQTNRKQKIIQKKKGKNN